MNGRSSVTLDDVAKFAGVSPKTVSRVLNREPNVRPKTREKVLNAAKELGYRPNLAARTLASSKSFTIAHFHNNPDQDYIARANAGIYRACREHNYLLIPEPLAEGSDDIAARLDAFLNTVRVDGIILTPPLTDDQRLLELINQRDLPVVAISPSADQSSLSSVGIDEKAAAKLMTQYLIDLGHQSINFISGPPDHGAAAARGDGFLEAIREGGLNEKRCSIERGDFSLRSGLTIATKMLDSRDRPSAVFAANDAMAVGAMTAAFKLGMSIPDDVSIAGFDASYIGSVVWPPLTSVKQPIGRMAETAARWLMTSQLETSPGAIKEVLDFELVERLSTAQVV